MLRRFLVPALFLVLVSVLVGAAPPLLQKEVKRKVVAGGGREMRRNGERVLHTIAEPATGRSSSANHTVSQGFWRENKAGRVTGVDEPTPERVLRYRLDQNHPNPFNPRTTIAYALPRDGHVRLAVYDLRGRQVAVLVDGTQTAGEHSLVFQADGLASGVYFYRLQAPGFEQVRRLVLAR
jgi:hypothetical protein